MITSVNPIEEAPSVAVSTTLTAAHVTAEQLLEMGHELPQAEATEEAGFDNEPSPPVT